MKDRNGFVSNSSSSSFILPAANGGRAFEYFQQDGELKLYKIKDVYDFLQKNTVRLNEGYDDEAVIPSYVWYHCDDSLVRKNIEEAYETNPAGYITKLIDSGDISYELYNFLDTWFKTVVEHW